MAYIKDYWKDKETRAEQAYEYTEKMGQKYEREIVESIRNTKEYGPDPIELCDLGVKNTSMEISVLPLDTVSAIGLMYTDYSNKIVALNFASYKNAGGMFLHGSKAQEECLCHESFLYNVLKEKDSFYFWNRNNKNAALYLNRALYSPRIMFNSNNLECFADVITCAAPNKSAAQKYKLVSDADNTVVLRSRIQFVLDIASDNHADVLVLGAYGCGVFGQDPHEVAAIFNDYLTSSHQNFKKVVFAIPEGKDKNYKIFKKVFEKEANYGN